MMKEAQQIARNNATCKDAKEAGQKKGWDMDKEEKKRKNREKMKIIAARVHCGSRRVGTKK
jgi:hypothetical protein